jgi:hypothetical protein
MILAAAAVVLILVLAAAGRRARQRQLVQSLKRHFISHAEVTLETSAPTLAAQLRDGELSRVFDWIYAEHLRRSGARDFAGLLRRGQQADLNPMSFDICLEAGEKLCAAHPRAAESESASAGGALFGALNLAGRAMYAEISPTEIELLAEIRDELRKRA